MSPCRAWTLLLEGEEEAKDSKDMHTEPATPAHSPGGDPQIRRQLHDIRITNQIMYLHPPIEDCRHNVLQQLVTSQNRIQSTRYRLRPSSSSYSAHHELYSS